jgi:alkylated DNA nucleotide flippase Atl1
MLAPLQKLSPAYHALAGVLNGGWSGTYGDLAVAIGRSRRSGRIVGRLVKGYARRHPSWPHDRVVSKRTGRPAYER